MTSALKAENPRQEIQPFAVSSPDQISSTSADGNGTTSISDQVVAKIAGIAASEVQGVHELTGTGLTGAISGLTQKVSGNDAHDFGVRVQVGQQETIVNLAMVVDYGASIPQIAKAVRSSISEQLKSMTGLIAREINIAVTDIHFPEQQTATVHKLQ